MNPKTKQKISVAVYFVISALMVVVALMLGKTYMDDRKAEMSQTEQDTMTETDTQTKTETEHESAVTVMQQESATEPDEIEPTKTDPPATEAETETEIDTDTESDTTTTLDRLYELFEKNAPLRWAKAETVESGDAVETSEKYPDFVKVYPKLAYFYKDLTSGETAAYNEDEIMYSASLIKALYVYVILEEIDNFEKSVRDSDEDGEIIYLDGEEKYDLDAVWTYDPSTMYESGSGEILYMPAGTKLTWRELIEYALLYSDNIAFKQLTERFGYSSFYEKADELGIKGSDEGFMNLSAKDCAIFLEEIYKYFETESENALLMKDCMIRSQHTVMISVHYPEGTVAHKYGWDIGAFHDMAIIFDEAPYLLVIMTDYDDGGKSALSFIADAVSLTKKIHAELHPEADESGAAGSDTTEQSETEADD